MITKRRITAALLAAAMGSMLVAGNGPAAADEAGGQNGATSDVFGMPLDELLADYPNARQLDDGAYQLAPGVRLLAPGWNPDYPVVQEPPSGCPDQHFCIYQHPHFQGWGLAFSSCERFVVSLMQFSSMHNAQNSAWAFFWQNSPYMQGALGPNRYIPDLSQARAPDGRSWDDRIDVIDPC